MKTLILCVDRDDDLGHKADIQTPVVGRRRVLDAATRLGVEDPEDSDTNALFAAVRLYDKELKSGRDPDRQVEVAAIAGHRLVGLKSDRILARQLEEALELSRADEVVLVSDGAEDEQIMPILTSRVKVAHVHRSIVKQAPRLEGFYYVLTRMLDDEKLAKRYVLPLGLIVAVWGVSILIGIERMAWGLTFAIAGGWLVVHALHWEDRITAFFRDFGEGLRAGKLTWIANAAMVLLWAVGGVQAAQDAAAADATTLQVLEFLRSFLWWFLGGLLVRMAGRLFDEWMRGGEPAFGLWSIVMALIALGPIGSVAVELAIELYNDTSFTSILTFDLVLRLLIGLAVAGGGFLLLRQLRTFSEPA